jgi:hypothetical protein
LKKKKISFSVRASVEVWVWLGGDVSVEEYIFIKLDGFLFDFVYLQMDVGMLYSKGGNERHAKLIVNGSLDSVSRLTLALSLLHCTPPTLPPFLTQRLLSFKEIKSFCSPRLKTSEKDEGNC